MSQLLIDLGGTRIKAGALDGASLKRTIAIDVPRAGGVGAIRDALAKAGADAMGGAAVDAVAMCAPGLHDENGTLVSLPGKLDGLEGTHLPSLLRQVFETDRVAVAHDAAAYAIGEAVAGADRDHDGAGTWGAGKLGGFIPISEDPSSPVDSNGTRGTIEALCSADALVACFDGAFTNVPAAYQAFAAGDDRARAGVARYKAHLARALVALAHAHGPDRIVLGGGPMQQGTPVFDGLEEMVNAPLFRGYRVEIRIAELGDTASLLGLAHVLRETA